MAKTNTELAQDRLDKKLQEKRYVTLKDVYGEIIPAAFKDYVEVTKNRLEESQ